jgi:hypothetical protein
MRTKAAVALGGIFVVLAAGSAWAHHAFSAEFDANKAVTLRGTVTKMDWVNPHSWLYIDVKNQDGTVQNWAIECGPPNSLMRGGWNKFSLPVGSEVIVEGFLAKTAKQVANGRSVSLPDGRKLFAGGSAPPDLAAK